MRKAKYDRKQVICKKSSCIGHSTNVARPGSWIRYNVDETGSMRAHSRIGRVLGRIDRADGPDGFEYRGWLAVIYLSLSGRTGAIAWVDPDTVRECYENPPANLFAWITGEQWVKTKGDIARIIAMAQHGTTGEEYIATRDDPDKPYNARPEYARQFVLEF